MLFTLDRLLSVNTLDRLYTLTYDWLLREDTSSMLRSARAAGKFLNVWKLHIIFETVKL